MINFSLIFILISGFPYIVLPENAFVLNCDSFDFNDSFDFLLNPE